MTYYLLNHLTAAELILVVVGVPALLAMIAVFFVDRAFPRLRELEIEDNVREVVGLLFGLLLALVIASVVSKQDDAESSAAAESTAVAQLARATRTFPIREQIRFQEALGQYVHAVVDDEFPAMRTGQRSPRTTAALESVYATFQNYRPKGEPNISVYRQALVQLDQVSADRRERLDISSQSLPGMLRVLLIFGAISFVALSYPVAIDSRRKKMLITGVITAFISLAYLLTIVLDNPFSGTIAVSDSSFKQGDLSIYWAGATAQRVAPGDLVALTPRDVVGVWNSDSYGPMVFRAVHGKILGAMRLARGTLVLHISHGILSGTWCVAPTRKLPFDIGYVDWRMTKSRGPNRLVGRWQYGNKGHYYGGWSLTRVGGPGLEPADVTPLFSERSRFCGS